ncbi:tyrosine-type recombinase/integrase [Frankia sp. AiPs1]
MLPVDDEVEQFLLVDVDEAGEYLEAEAPVRALTEEEARRVLAVALVDRMAALWLVLLALGLCKGEALALRWEALDLDAGTVAVVRKQRRRKAGIDPETGRQRWELVEEEDLKTKGSKAVLVLPAMVVTMLRAHKQRQDAAKAELDAKAEEVAKDLAALAGRDPGSPADLEIIRWADPGLVFTTAVGRRIDPRNVNRRWDAVCERAQVGHTRVHDIRHTAATMFFRAGVDLNEIRALLRHTRLATTADIYVAFLEDVRRGTASSLHDILTRLQNPAETTESDDLAGRCLRCPAVLPRQWQYSGPESGRAPHLGWGCGALTVSTVRAPHGATFERDIPDRTKSIVPEITEREHRCTRGYGTGEGAYLPLRVRRSRGTVSPFREPGSSGGVAADAEVFWGEP